MDHMITRNYNGADGSVKQLHYQVEQDGYEGKRETDNKHGCSDPPSNRVSSTHQQFCHADLEEVTMMKWARFLLREILPVVLVCCPRTRRPQ